MVNDSSTHQTIDPEQEFVVRKSGNVNLVVHTHIYTLICRFCVFEKRVSTSKGKG